jgi:hypothetical protein
LEPAPAPAPAPKTRTKPDVPRPEAPVTAPVEPTPPAEPQQIDVRQLKDETALLDTARASLAGDDPAAALAALDRHASQFAEPILGAEAQVIRIDALLRTDHEAGVALGERFLAKYPKSPHAKRVRSLLARKSP